MDITGHSFYKYIHPCDQDNLAKQLGGQVPLEDMEIFDGMFCSDTSQFVKNPKQGITLQRRNQNLGQTSKISFFAKIVNDFQSLTIFIKNSILDVWQGFQYANAINLPQQKLIWTKWFCSGQFCSFRFS